DWETLDVSAALSGRDAAGADLVFVGSKGCEYFGLLARRDLEEDQGPSEFRCELIEFRGRDAEVTVSFLKTEWRRTPLRGSELVGTVRNVANPQRSHELKAGQPSEILGVPFRHLRVLELLADDRVFQDGFAEVIHHG